MTRMGIGSGTVFAVVALALIVLALASVGARWVLAISIVLAGAQLFGAVGLRGNRSKSARRPRRVSCAPLGVDPTLGFALNLAYSCTAASLFLWALTRALISRSSDPAS